MIIRGLLAIVSVVVIAWLAVLLRDAVLVDRVGSIAFEAHPTASQLERGLSWSRQAQFLNPDSSLPLSWEAEMYWLRGQTAPALRVYERIAARLAARHEHFMRPSLLDSQFADLEEPAADEPAIRVDIGPPAAEIAELIIEDLGLAGRA